MKEFFDKYKVFLIGLAGFILLTVQQFAANGENVDWKVLGLAVAIAAVGYISKNWRGQSASIIGTLGNAAFAFTTVYDSGNFTWSQFFLQLLLVFGFAFLPDAKSRGYEQTATIKQAKIEGEIIVPAALTNIEIKKEASNAQVIKNFNLNK